MDGSRLNSDSDAPDDIAGARVRLIVVPVEVLGLVAEAKFVAKATGGRAQPVDLEWPGVGMIPGEVVASMPAEMRLEQLAEDPTLRAWLLRGVVVADDASPTGSRIVGAVGGHGAPDENGAAEIGYTVASAERRNGFATEAGRAWFGWATANGAGLARLSIAADNGASLAVARKLGLVEVGSAWDERDQRWELVHEGPLPLADSTPS
ncbi:MAG TPA: GNAT family N-acetyltransferase [Acidimicrobiales bacterium]